MRVTKLMLEAAQRAEVEFRRANRGEYPDTDARPLTPPDLIRAMLQAGYAVGFPPQRGGRRPPPREF